MVKFLTSASIVRLVSAREDYFYMNSFNIGIATTLEKYRKRIKNIQKPGFKSTYRLASARDESLWYYLPPGHEWRGPSFGN